MKIIYNPIAGRRRSILLWRVLDILAANGVKVDLAETVRAGHATTLARDAAGQGVRLIVAAGGDGTIAEVANGLAGSPAHLGIIPLGTANVLAHELALPFAPNAVAAALAFGRTRALWPGVVRRDDTTRLFVQMVGVGFDAHVVHALSPWLKAMVGRGAYVFQTLRELRRYDFDPIPVRLDGVETQAASVIVSKGRLYGGAYRLTADQDPGEEGFTVVLFDRGGPGMTLLHGAALPLNLLARAPGVRHVRAHRVEFIGNRPVPVQADGDKAGWLPLAISSTPGPIRVVVGS